MLQLKEMDWESIYGIVGDDIYYDEHKYEIKSYFRVKDENKFGLMAW